MNNLHILGASHPAREYLSKINNRKEFMYSSKKIIPNIEDNLFIEYSSINENFKNGDLIVSFSPINLATKIINRLYDSNKIASKIILISSSSIYSKVNEKSLDIKKYIHFKDGENEALKIFKLYSNETSIIILRPTMIWGDHKDKNIHKIYSMLKRFNFFPVSTNASGLRSPIHYEDLSNLILKLINIKQIGYNIYDVHGTTIIEYKKLVEYIKTTIPNSNKARILYIPEFIIKILSLIIKYLPDLTPFDLLKSIVSILQRQSKDLVYFNNDILKIIPDFESYNLIERINTTYKEKI